MNLVFIVEFGLETYLVMDDFEINFHLRSAIVQIEKVIPEIIEEDDLAHLNTAVNSLKEVAEISETSGIGWPD